MPTVPGKTIQRECLFLLNSHSDGQIARHQRSLAVDVITGLGNTECEHRNRKHRQTDVAKSAAAGDPDTTKIGIGQFTKHYGQPLADGGRTITKIAENLAYRRLVIRDASLGRFYWSGNAKENPLAIRTGLTHQLRDDAPNDG